jgi:hypothetical protein
MGLTLGFQRVVALLNDLNVQITTRSAALFSHELRWSAVLEPQGHRRMDD